MTTDYHGSIIPPSFPRFCCSITCMKRDPVVHSINTRTNETIAQERKLEAFQKQVTQMFHNLSLVESDELLSVSWLSKLLDVFLCCQEQFRVILSKNKSIRNKQASFGEVDFGLF